MLLIAGYSIRLQLSNQTSGAIWLHSCNQQCFYMVKLGIENNFSNSDSQQLYGLEFYIKRKKFRYRTCAVKVCSKVQSDHLLKAVKL